MTESLKCKGYEEGDISVVAMCCRSAGGGRAERFFGGVVLECRELL